MFGIFAQREDFDPARDIPDLTGKVFLITGGNSGLGKETIAQLAAHNPAKIYLAARTAKKAEDAILEIHQSVPRAHVEFLELDLASFASIAAAARSFTERSDRLDVLINNAGIMAVPFSTTKEGYEIQFGTNHMGHALLTRLLMPTLLRTAELPGSDVRVICLSSEGHSFTSMTGGIMYEAGQAEKATTVSRYGTSKLANLLFARELADRYPTIAATSVHPGVIDTQLFDSTRGFVGKLPLIGSLACSMAALFMSSVQQGARNQLWAATADREKVRRGFYFLPVGVRSEGRSYTGKTQAVELWEWTDRELTKHGY